MAPPEVVEGTVPISPAIVDGTKTLNQLSPYSLRLIAPPCPPLQTVVQHAEDLLGRRAWSARAVTTGEPKGHLDRSGEIWPVAAHPDASRYRGWGLMPSEASDEEVAMADTAQVLEDVKPVVDEAGHTQLAADADLLWTFSHEPDVGRRQSRAFKASHMRQAFAS